MKLSPLAYRVKKRIEELRLFTLQDHLIVCVSGGADSIALLRVLLEIQNVSQIQLTVLHCNHGVRPESLEDQQFVQQLAKDVDVPFVAYASSEFSASMSGFQEKARIWRREVACHVMQEQNAQAIALAHHQDDQVETWLMKLLRGCHFSHLQGMGWKSFPFVRPLLDCKKKELQSYLQSCSQSWQEDSSNLSNKYLRNRVRHELVPLLQELSRNGLYERVNDYSQQSVELCEWLQRYPLNAPTKNQNQLSISWLQTFPQFVQKVLLHEFLSEITQHTIEQKHIQKLIELMNQVNQKWEWNLSGSYRVVRDSEFLQIIRSKE